MIFLTARVSAANIATVYNTATAPTASPVSPRLPTLTYEVVLDAFFLHALLQDKTREGRDNARLVLPHDGLQEHRFDAALRDRNRKIRHHGQEMWAHACSDCVKRLQRQDGSIGMPTVHLFLVWPLTRPHTCQHTSLPVLQMVLRWVILVAPFSTVRNHLKKGAIDIVPNTIPVWMYVQSKRATALSPGVLSPVPIQPIAHGRRNGDDGRIRPREQRSPFFQSDTIAPRDCKIASPKYP